MNYNLGFNVNDKVPDIRVGDAENLKLDDESVDLIITSPPYNMGSDRWPMGKGKHRPGNKPRPNGVGYDDDLAEFDYQEWQISCLQEWYRVAKQGASLFYSHKNRSRDGQMLSPLEWLLSTDNPWVLRQEIVWDRGLTHNHCTVLFWPHTERVYWLTKGKPILPDKSVGMSDVWRFPPGIGTWHPAPFPPELPWRCLEAVGRPGITVLDPFGGSMTTCKVAAAMGYNSIGVDSSAEYVERAIQENGWSVPV